MATSTGEADQTEWSERLRFRPALDTWLSSMHCSKSSSPRRVPVARWSHGTGQGCLAGRHVDGIDLLSLVKSTLLMADAGLKKETGSKAKRRAISKRIFNLIIYLARQLKLLLLALLDCEKKSSELFERIGWGGIPFLDRAVDIQLVLWGFGLPLFDLERLKR